MPIAVLFYLLSAAVVGYSVYRVRGTLDEKKIPLVGMVAAGIFAAQMLNWPIPGGTSAHLVGGAIAAILLGPYLGCLAMTSVLVIQCLLFGDGGITALGANVWNMAVVNVFVAHYLYVFLRDKGLHLASFVSGWLGITAAAIFAGIEVGLSSSFKYSIGVTVPTMGIWHGLLGLLEGVITAAVILYIAKNRPDILNEEVSGE
jgi:cobalt/nickel transport system permease protein